MKIVAVSDLHGHLPEVPECDLLLVAGDLVPASRQYHGNMPAQAGWLNGPFRLWLENAPAKAIVGVAGNHDSVFERAPALVPRDLRWSYLEDDWTTAGGLKIYGTPWQPRFYDWAFNADPPKMRAIAAQIPGDADLLVMHGPPHGYGDFARRVAPASKSHAGCMASVTYHYVNVGCPHLLSRVAELTNLKLVVFGHIHSGHGVYGIDRPGLAHGRTVLANVALVDEDYRPAYGITRFHYDEATGRVEAI